MMTIGEVIELLKTIFQAIIEIFGPVLGSIISKPEEDGEGTTEEV